MVKTIDDAPISGFHLRVTAFTTGGMFVDGWILGLVGYGLVGAKAEFGLASWWVGLIGAGALIGIFAGSLAFGRMTDLVGRKAMFTADVMLFVVTSVAQLFVTSPIQLLVLRILMGVAIGAEYAIGSALLSEIVPKRHRGAILSSLETVWTAGFVAAAVVGVFTADIAGDHWRWILASSAIPATVVLLLRLGAPESPRWLASRGRFEEAQHIIDEYWGPEYRLPAVETPASSSSADYRELFGPDMWRRTVFAGVFWLCQVAPLFAIFTFLPQVIKTLGLDSSAGDLLANIFLLIGSVVALVVMDRMKRRTFMISTFAILSIVLGIIGIATTSGQAPPGLILACFIVFACVIGGAANAEFVYPAEIFPTRQRATGIGIAAATSRVGAAIGTFLLPTTLDTFGVGPTMLACTGLLCIGLIVSWYWAPETRGVALDAEGERPA